MSHPTRRALAVLLLGALGALAMPPARRGATAAPGPVRPNVLVIVTDDQRAATLNVMPATRRWFKWGGTRYTQAFATTPLCCPSRASIFTGRYAHNHGVRKNTETGKLDMRSTIQAYLQRAGYRTGIFGKFLNSFAVGNNPPFFDAWATFPNSSSRYVGGAWNVDGTVRTVTAYATDFIARRAKRFVADSESRDSQPWFMYLTPPAPHLPYTPEARYAAARVPPWDPSPAVLERDRSDKPPFVQDHSVPLRRMRKVRKGQLRTLLSVDDLVGAVFAKLGKLGERRPTLAIFMSDNGHLWGEHGLGGKGFGKRPPYTASSQIPLFVRWPGHVARGGTDDRLAANIDVAPTIARVAGVTPNPSYPMDGRSLLSARRRTRLLLEYWIDIGTTPDWAATRTASYQYVEYYLRDGLEPTFREYYDLRSDPWELRNPFGNDDESDDPDVRVISDQLARDRRCSGAECP